MKQETETFFGVTMTELESNINHFLDEPGIKYVNAKYYRDEDENYVADVTYLLITSDKEEYQMQATVEKPTCTYELVGGYAFTECGQKNWEHTTADLTTCQNCGKKIKRVERNDG